VTRDSFPRQQARTRRFTLGAPRSFSVSPDDARVVFLRSRSGEDPANCLWVLDVATEAERLVADPVALGVDDTDLPAEERARRERLRESGGGITGYATDADLRRATFALAGRVYVVDLVGDAEPTPVAGSDGAFDPRLDPTGRRVAFARDDALWVAELTGSDPRCLCAEPDADAASWGLAEFVAAEEMGRFRGFWWSPGGDRLLVARADTGPVDRWHIAAPVAPGQAPTTVRYPAAGTANADVSLWLVDLDGGRTEVSWDRPGYEYLARVVWADGHDPIISVQTRDQRTVLVMDVDPATGATTPRHRQERDDWVELVAGAPAWAGERLVTVDDRDPARRLCLDGQTVTPDHLQVQSVVSADDDRVRFLAASDPTELHVFELAIADGTVRPLTTAPGIHRAVAGSRAVVIVSATLERNATVVEVHPAGEAEPLTIASHAETPLLTPRPQLQVVGRRDLRVAVLYPERGPDGPLPVLLDPYGGPHALRVQSARAAFGPSQWFADQGFVVIVADGRGTPMRGPAWEREVRGDLAGPPLDDQIDALHAVAEQDDRLDLSRVAIRGWSFGGYLAALAVLRRPDVFHAAVAGAPVTEWRLYDTHYTERYLGHPAEVPEHYDATSLLPLAPDLTRPLMLIHGLADDNVVAAHTLQLSRALLEAGRPHEVLPLSGVTHMTPQESVAENLLLLQVEFLRRTLARPA
jgi:dipeptidyl-peptidase-4